MSDDVIAGGWMALGVLIAVILPVLRALVLQEFPRGMDVGIPPWLRRYLALSGLSIVAAIICLAVWKSQNPTGTLTWYAALLIGFSWESFIEKIGRP